MPEKLAVPLGDVQKTLFLPLWGRALEAKKPHPLLLDPTAVRIMESVDFDFATLARNLKSITRHAWIARSREFIHEGTRRTFVASSFLDEGWFTHRVAIHTPMRYILSPMHHCPSCISAHRRQFNILEVPC